MIDGIKAILTNKLDEIRSCPLLEFMQTDKTSVKTGEVESVKYRIARYRGLTFIDKGNIIEMRGSIHIYNNKGRHNYDNFGLSDIHRVLFELENKLFIQVDEAEIKNIEFGVNLDVDFNPADFLNSLIVHKSQLFTHRIAANMNYRECEHSQFFIKIYDKGKQHGLDRSILRIELKFIKMEKINSLGIKYLSDLLDLKKLQMLREELLRVYDEILIGDLKMEPEGLSPKNQLDYANGHNPLYWASKLPCKDDYSTIQGYRSAKTTYYRRLGKFRDLLSQTGADERQKRVRCYIGAQCNHLLEIAQNELSNPVKCVKLTSLGGVSDNEEVCQIDQPSNSEKVCQIDQDIKSVDVCQIDPLFYNVKNRQTEGRKCIVTGLDISMQKDDSKFLCTAGILWYKENDLQIWMSLKERLSDRWASASIEKKVEEIHHSIRNEYFNPINKRRQQYREILSYPSLFDLNLTLKSEYREELKQVCGQ